MKRTRIVLADDHTLVLEGLHKLLENEYDIVGMAEDGRTLLKVAQEQYPDVVVLDISMPQLNGLDAARQLHKLLPTCKIIFLTMHADPAYAKEAFQAGASGYLLKRSAASELILAIQAVLKDHFYVTPEITKDVLLPLYAESERSLNEESHLTSRQREVLQLVAEGKSVKDIASSLNISSKTVEYHKTKLMRELDLYTTVDLTKYAVAKGLVSEE